MSADAKKYLDVEGLSYFWGKIKSHVAEAVANGTSDVANSIHFAVPNEKSAAAELTATVDGVDSLSPGLVIALRMPFDNAEGTTLNVNNLGAKPVYYKSNAADAGVFPEGTVALLVYETTSIGTGCFKAVYSYTVPPSIYQGASASASGIAGLVPAALSNEKDKYLKGDGTWASTNIGLSLEHVPAGTKTVSIPYSPEAAEMGVSNDGEGFWLGTFISIDNETVYNENKTHPVGNIPLDCSSLNINDDSVINVSFKATSGGGDFWLRYTLEANLNDLISSGTEGMPLVEDTSYSLDYSPLPENKEFRVSLTDEGNGQYSLYPFIAEQQAVPAENNLVVVQPDGTTTKVSLNALLGDAVQNISFQEKTSYQRIGDVHWIDPTQWLYYNNYNSLYRLIFLDEDGNILEHSITNPTSESVTVSFDDGEPVSVQTESEYGIMICQGNCDWGEFIKFDSISVQEVLSAGEDGILIKDAFRAGLNAYPYSTDTDAILSLADNGNGSYTLRLATCKSKASIEPDLQLERLDGTAESVDLNPLFNHIGGRIEEQSNRALPTILDEEPTQFPFYSYEWILEEIYDESGVWISPQYMSWTYEKNVLTVQFDSNKIPYSFYPWIDRYDTDSETPSFSYTTEFDIENEEYASVSISDALQSGFVELNEYVYDNNAFPLEATGQQPIFLVIEKTSDDPYTLQFRLTNGQKSHVLHIEKSESNVIDLSPLTDEHVVKTYTEVEPHSRTETATEHREYEGTIVSGDDNYWFYLTFGFSDTSTSPTTYSELDIDIFADLSEMESGQDYVFNFTVNGTPEAIGIYAERWSITDRNGNTSFIDYSVMSDSTASSIAQNDNYASINYGYEAWEGSQSLVKTSFPVGLERTFAFNVKSLYGYPNSVYETSFDKLGMTVTIVNVDGTNYTLTFHWDYSEDEEVERTVNWKELKTTVERCDGTSTVERRLAAGFLQNVSIAKESSYVIEGRVATNGTYHPYICINDEDEES